MKERIFVVVLVTYDYYRFQTNLFASTDKKECIKFCKKYNKGREEQYLIVLKEKNSTLIDTSSEVRHLWIQEFKKEQV
uniref:Uncharacterized protein n=1 Tax=viral metagenome TaxID=1070528 RepID=A0A6M3JJD0_9ZZZZ